MAVAILSPWGALIALGLSLILSIGVVAVLERRARRAPSPVAPTPPAGPQAGPSRREFLTGRPAAPSPAAADPDPDAASEAPDTTSAARASSWVVGGWVPDVTPYRVAADQAAEPLWPLDAEGACPGVDGPCLVCSPDHEQTPDVAPEPEPVALRWVALAPGAPGCGHVLFGPVEGPGFVSRACEVCGRVEVAPDLEATGPAFPPPLLLDMACAAYDRGDVDGSDRLLAPWSDAAEVPPWLSADEQTSSPLVCQVVPDGVTQESCWHPSIEGETCMVCGLTIPWDAPVPSPAAESGSGTESGRAA